MLSYPSRIADAVIHPSFRSGDDAVLGLEVDDVPAMEKLRMSVGDRFSPTEDAIATLAYEFWSRRGSPVGSPEEDWFHAVGQIKHACTPGSVV